VWLKSALVLICITILHDKDTFHRYGHIWGSALFEDISLLSVTNTSVADVGSFCMSALQLGMSHLKLDQVTHF